MAITLYYHPMTRAAGTVWALEELGRPYELKYLDLQSGAHKQADFLAVNPMGKLPTLVDGEVVATEASAIALYLGDRYSLGELAPATELREAGLRFPHNERRVASDQRSEEVHQL